MSYMTNTYYNKIKKFKKEQFQNHKKKIFIAIQNLGGTKITSGQIFKYFSSKFKEKEEQKKKSIFLDDDNNTVKETISLRTIQRHLQNLTKEGILECESNKYYSLTKKEISLAKIYGSEFGYFALQALVKQEYPLLLPLEHNLRRLIETFGIFLIFCFLEAARPLENNEYFNSLSKYEKDQLALSWIENTFDLTTMYEYFLSVVKNQPTDKEIPKNIKHCYFYKLVLDKNEKIFKPVDISISNSKDIIKNEKNIIIRPKSKSEYFNDINNLFMLKLRDYGPEHPYKRRKPERIKKSKGYSISKENIENIEKILFRDYKNKYLFLSNFSRGYVVKNKEGKKIKI